MNDMKYTLLTEVMGQWKAEIIESFLGSEGIRAVLIQDSLSQSTYSSPFASVQIFVPNENLEQARELLKTFEESAENDDGATEED